jgi:hypothetical protein
VLVEVAALRRRFAYLLFPGSFVFFFIFIIFVSELHIMISSYHLQPCLVSQIIMCNKNKNLYYSFNLNLNLNLKLTSPPFFNFSNLKTFFLFFSSKPNNNSPPFPTRFTLYLLQQHLGFSFFRAWSSVALFIKLWLFHYKLYNLEKLRIVIFT